MAGGLALLLLIPALLWRYLAEPVQVIAFEERDWVLISSFENRTGETLFDGTLEQALKHTLVNSRFVNVVPRVRIQDTLQNSARATSTGSKATLGRRRGNSNDGRKHSTRRRERTDLPWLPIWGMLI